MSDNEGTPVKDKGQRCININYLLVDKKYRNKGYGRRLVECFNGKDILCTGMKATRESAAFWVKMGFWFGKHLGYPNTLEERNSHLDIWKTHPQVYIMMMVAVMDPNDGLIEMIKEGSMSFKEIYEKAKQ